MYPPIDPIAFELGPLTVRWYGIFMMLAVVLGAQVASAWVKRKGKKVEDFWDMLLWVLIPAFIGARLYYVFIQSPRGAAGLGDYLSHPSRILQIWGGGIHIFGAFIFGGIALWLFTRIRNLPTSTFLDAVGLALPLSQAVGRLGNFINQELYGPPTDLPWGLKIDLNRRIAPYNDLGTYPETVRFHPLFLYEMLWNLIGFSLLFWISRRFEKQLKPGDLALIYVIWYPLGRFFIEFLRTDSWFFANTPFNFVHILSAFAVVLGANALYRRHRRRQTTPPSAS